MSVTAALVRAILEQHDVYDWTVQGFGMLRTNLANVGRIHVWDSRLAVPLVSSMHTHPWPLRSTVISGELVNQIFKEQDDGPLRYLKTVIKCGEGGGISKEPPTEVRLMPTSIDAFRAGDTYFQTADVIHRSIPQDGTVTLLQRPKGMSDAFVYWPVGTKWVSAEPKPIIGWQLSQAIDYALERWDDGSQADVEPTS